MIGQKSLPRDVRAYLPWFRAQYVKNGGPLYWVLRTIATLLVFALMVWVIANAFSLAQGKGFTNPWGQPVIQARLSQASYRELVVPGGGGARPVWHKRHFTAHDLGQWGNPEPALFAHPREANMMLYKAVKRYKHNHPYQATHSVDWYMHALHTDTLCLGNGRTYPGAGTRVDKLICNGANIGLDGGKTIHTIEQVTIAGACAGGLAAMVVFTDGTAPLIAGLITGGVPCGWHFYDMFAKKH